MPSGHLGNYTSLTNVTKSGENWMLQRIVRRDDEDYTVGIFGLGAANPVGPIIFRRILARAGHTGFTEVVEDAAIRDMTSRIVRHFAPFGPTNLQFRLGPVCIQGIPMRGEF